MSTVCMEGGALIGVLSKRTALRAVNAISDKWTCFYRHLVVYDKATIRPRSGKIGMRAILRCFAEGQRGERVRSFGRRGTS